MYQQKEKTLGMMDTRKAEVAAELMVMMMVGQMDTIKDTQKVMKKEDHLDTPKDLKLEKQVLVNSLLFVSPFTRDLLKLHFSEIANPELFEELENQCKNLVLTKIDEYNRVAEAARARSKTAESVIGRIEHYFIYSQHKQSPKMRFTIKEYDHAMSLLDDIEKKKVEKWLEDNGGLDKYVFSGYTAG